MPRPTKAYRRHKINAALEWKRGKRAEAYKLWAQADASLKAHRAKKRNKKAAAEAAKASG